MATSSRSPFLAALLSAIAPGLGHLYLGLRSQALSLLCVTAGLWIGILAALIGPEAFRSRITALLLAFLYPFVWFPAIWEARQQALRAGDGIPASPTLSQRTWYVVAMLLTVGPGALHMLWAAPQFSRTAKWLWTALVLSVFFLSLLAALWFIPMAERMAGEMGLSLHRR